MSIEQTVIVNSVSADPWADLDVEFEAWASEGRCASLWWRDDDAVAAGPKLDQLVDISSNAGLLLAVIPARLDESLAPALMNVSHVHIAQHGYAHVNHAQRGLGQGAWELGLDRGEAAVLADLEAGRVRLQGVFGPSFLPVIVPPWNRIAPELMQPIAASGYVGVSAFGRRGSKNPTPGLLVVNAHCDPIRWKSGPRFAGESKTIGQLIEHLQARRTVPGDTDEPTGFLTHHIDLDSAGWDFCIRLAKMVEAHAGAQWVCPHDVFEAVS
jgi:hypothetical protein